MNLFQRFLSVWVGLAMVVGILLGHYFPAIPDALDRATVAHVSIPIAVLLWGMILPMMLQIDFRSVVGVVQQPRVVLMTSLVSYVCAPFTMYGFARLFFHTLFGDYLGKERADGYLVGAVLLGCAPCTAMVFVWSRLMRGNGAYTLTQVAVNDLILLVTYVPTVQLLLGAGANIEIPWSTLVYSVAFFVLVPLVVGVGTRVAVAGLLDERWFHWLEGRVIPALDACSMWFLVGMVVLLFVSQAATLVENVVDMLVIALPLLMQTVMVWAITYGAMAWWLRVPYDRAGPATLIACSNFFEMAVAVAVAV